MGFRWKIVFSSIILVAIAISVSGYLLLNISLNGRWENEYDQAIEENIFVCASVGEAASTSGGIAGSADRVANSLGGTGVTFTVIGSNGDEIFSNSAGVDSADIMDVTDSSQKSYVAVTANDGTNYIAVSGMITTASGTATVVSFRNITDLFEVRSRMLTAYTIIAAVIIVAAAVVSYYFAKWVTKPMAELAKVSAGMAGGDYSVRCDARGDDEFGDLGRTFNFMAESVEDHINILTEESRRKEEFVANFTHEIKTPMTSVVGYADMIRSRNLSDEMRTLCADYIFNEGMRLQTMSLKLFELFLMEEEDIMMKKFALRPWIEDVAQSVFPLMYSDGIKLQVECPNVSIEGEADLLKTAFINILDNARKASEKGGTIWFRVRMKEGYVSIEVEDRGIGIPKEEIDKITEAFYMVDKSRSRESGGAGLGLALTQRILKIHGTRLHVQSKQGFGTRMSARFAIVEGGRR